MINAFRAWSMATTQVLIIAAPDVHPHLLFDLGGMLFHRLELGHQPVPLLVQHLPELGDLAAAEGLAPKWRLRHLVHRDGPGHFGADLANRRLRGPKSRTQA